MYPVLVCAALFWPQIAFVVVGFDFSQWITFFRNKVVLKIKILTELQPTQVSQMKHYMRIYQKAYF